MRFHYGAVPEDPDFFPEAEGWLAIREPGPWMLQLMALPVAVILLLLSAALLYLVFPGELFLNTSSPGTISIPILPFLFISILIIPVHELLHAICHPGWGLSSNSVIGLWLSRGLFYANYEGPMSRNRFLLIFTMPYLVLSWLPIPLIALSGIFGWIADTVLSLAYVSLAGGVLACADVVGFWLVISQIPGSASVRNKGWKTYWKPGE
jgi:hypothetical protein